MRSVVLQRGSRPPTPANATVPGQPWPVVGLTTARTLSQANTAPGATDRVSRPVFGSDEQIFGEKQQIPPAEQSDEEAECNEPAKKMEN
jgi:hypothetical protein